RVVRASGRVVGIDPSAGMMAAGRRATGHMPLRTITVPLVRAIGERLPFPSGRFDFVAMGYALRHVRDLDEAFEEYRRVLRPSGRLLVLEITAPANSVGRTLARIYFGSIVPAVARLGSVDAARMMRFYWETIDRCVPPETVLDSLRRVGL